MISACRWRSGEQCRAPRAALARGPARGRRYAPRQRRLLTQSLAAIEAAARHARHGPGRRLCRSRGRRAGARRRTRRGGGALNVAGDVVFTTGSGNAGAAARGVALTATVACLPGNTDRTWPSSPPTASTRTRCRSTTWVGWMWFAAPRCAPTRGDGAPGPRSAAIVVWRNHVAAVAAMCRDLGVPLVIDAAQALARSTASSTPTRSTSRRASGWPAARVGVLAVRPAPGRPTEAPTVGAVVVGAGLP